MQFANSTFASLLKPIDRRRFQALVDKLDGDSYDKTFKSWAHVVTMLHGQFSHSESLRAVESAFNANSHHHYHLNVGKVARSTLADANARRPVGVFTGLFSMLVELADRQTRREGVEVVRLIDASPIPLGKTSSWATWNGRIRGMKMHVVYDPGTDRPCRVEVTAANVNDITFGRSAELQAGVTYVFDKAYCHFGWWKKINDAKAFFVTRSKNSVRWRATHKRFVRKVIGDGFRVLDDAEVVLASKGDSKLPIPMRRVRVKRDNGKKITLITNDMERSAFEIAELYKGRWQIELLFRWMKQHLDIRKFLGSNENAIRLQIVAAMIAYLLLRIAARLNRITMPVLRFAELVCQRLFWRQPLARIDKPPPVNPSRRQPTSPNQLSLAYG